MSDVICRRGNCSYRGASGFCQRAYVHINAVGACDIWYDEQGNPRAVPAVSADIKVQPGYAKPASAQNEGEDCDISDEDIERENAD